MTIFNSKLLERYVLRIDTKFFFFLFPRVRRDEYYPFVQNSQSHAQAGSSQIDITYVYCS